MTPLNSTPAFAVGTTRHLLGTLVTLKAAADDTGGAFTLVEIAVGPGQGTPPHKHDDAESFYITAGDVHFELDGQTMIRGTGSFIHLPAGSAHSFRNMGNTPARMLGLNMPGGPHVRFFAEVGEPVDDASTFPPLSPPDVPRLIEAGLRHGITILPSG